jgi:alpha-ketoglutarate-dependent 2,4-dichlorophenoxyacetate dioxygenase
MLKTSSILQASRSLCGPHLRRGLATATTTTTVRATPLSERFGAEVSGIDWSRPLSPEVVRTIIELQNKWGVLAFRQTGLTDDSHVTYSKNFGALETAHALNKPRRASSVHLYDAGNLGPDDKIIPQHSRAWWHTKANGLWHTDSSFRQHRSSYSALRAVELPPAGGQTRYADMRAAYSGLPQDLKDAAENAVAEHWIWHSRKLAAPGEFEKPTEEERTAIPAAYHKVVQLAPDGVSNTLYVASHIRKIVGMSERDSTALIKALLDHAQQEKYQIGVKWKNVGDIVQWDNRCTMHRATAFKDQENRRDMRRTTVFDYGSAAFGVKHELGQGDVDLLVGGSRDIAAERTPETQTQQQIFDL